MFTRCAQLGQPRLSLRARQFGVEHAVDHPDGEGRRLAANRVKKQGRMVGDGLQLVNERSGRAKLGIGKTLKQAKLRRRSATPIRQRAKALEELVEAVHVVRV